MKNSPGEFQRMMDAAMGHLYPRGVSTYIDDIVIWGDDLPEVTDKLRGVLQSCRDSGLFLNLKKTKLMHEEIGMLGHQVGRWGIRAQEKHLVAMRKAVRPKDKGELRSFLGTASYVRRFVPHFSTMLAPLNHLLKKKVEFQWGTEQNEAFEAIRHALIERVTLQPLCGDGPICLVTDASNVGVGCACLQYNEGEFNLLGFA
ncbi:MAG: hypothetical protein KVP17_004077, partial [Porospora cf. gigantea B]|uniref:uncharacterized protein n=1 Tax=Porospora cf. gigantea B TaxID=2853592 RepID=UPI003571BD10